MTTAHAVAGGGSAFLQEALLAGGGPAALSGDRVVLGGSTVTVHVRNGTTWTMEQSIPGEPTEHFGYDVDIDGDTLVVSAPYSYLAGGPVNAGYAQIFVRNGSTWTLQQTVTASDAASNDLFGLGLALEGDTLVVGAWHHDDGAPDAGAAYVFVRNGTTWSEQQKLLAYDAEADDGFGISVAISGETIAVGAPSAQLNRGSVYVFVRDGTTWSLQQEIFSLDSSVSDDFGIAVALDGDTAVIGARHDDAPLFNSGSAYVWVRSGTTWSEQQKLVTAHGASGDRFGSSVAISVPWVVVGAPYNDDLGSNAGVVVAYSQSGTVWTETQRFGSSMPGENGNFGWGVALEADTAVAGNRVFRAVPSPYGVFCDASDGSLLACPCGNVGLADTGCDIAQGTGGVRLRAEAIDFASPRVLLVGLGFPASTHPTVLAIRATSVQGAQPFGDGVRCLGSSGLTRLGAVAGSGGISLHVLDHTAGPGTFYYQLWFRNSPMSFCDAMAAFNLSNGISIAW
jgi:hypothetical protein